MEGGTAGWDELRRRFGRGPWVLYLAGPLRGDGTPEAILANQVRMMARARLIQEFLPEATLVVPHGNFAFVDEAGPCGLEARAKVLSDCERLLLRCDGLVLCGRERSPGMVHEEEAARRAGLPVVRLLDPPTWGTCGPERRPA
jgi:hypothetical protein